MAPTSSIAARILGRAKEVGALRSGEFSLSGGGTSSYYFDGRRLTLDPEGASLVAQAVLDTALECGAQAIAGPTLGADPMVSAVALLSELTGRGRVVGLIVRKEPKGHGTTQLVEGPLEPGCRVVVVDDTCTSGASLLHAIQAVEAEGCDVVRVLVVLDRNEGGSRAIRERGYDFEAILAVDDKGRVAPVKPKGPD